MARHKIEVDTGKGRSRELDVILDEADEDYLDVIAEEVPTDLPTIHGGRPITWLTNYRIKKKPGKAGRGGTIEYTIEIDDPGGQLVYFDVGERTVVFINTRSVGRRLQATLGVEDPPIGHT